MSSGTNHPELTYWLNRSPRKTPALPDTLYDDSHCWQNANDRVMFQREFSEPDPARRKIAQAMIASNPLTQGSEIEANMTARPSSNGGSHHVLTVDDMFTGDLNGAKPRNMNDFTGTAWGNEGPSSHSDSYPSQRPW